MKEADWKWIKEIADDNSYCDDYEKMGYEPKDIEQELCRAIVEIKNLLKR